MQVQVAEEAAVLARPGAVPVDVAQPILAATLLAAHMPGIDVLRGIAVLLVVAFHGLAYHAPNVRWGSRIADAVYGVTAWGWLGVNLFFVISGFLITGILDDTIGRENFYQRFYLRRALRILPAYLAVLALAWATGFITPNYIMVCVFFLANMPGLFLRHGYTLYGPLWSLAVEEQFYLLWPMLYRKLRRKGMLIVSAGLLVVCPALRALAFAHLIHTGDVLSKTWMVADNLALGALMAILLRGPGIKLQWVVALGWVQFAAGGAGVLALFLVGRMGKLDVLRNSVGLSCFLLLCGSAVVAMLCLFRERRLPGWMRVFVFFGDISYGLYLVHLLLLQIYDQIAGSGFQSDWRLLLIRFGIANGVAVGLAVLSKRYFEDPILRLKSRIVAAR
jgi:peptidoglycan/LPS O-acetylase OafA/YrhL